MPHQYDCQYHATFHLFLVDALISFATGIHRIWNWWRNINFVKPVVSNEVIDYKLWVITISLVYVLPKLCPTKNVNFFHTVKFYPQNCVNFLNLLWKSHLSQSWNSCQLVVCIIKITFVSFCDEKNGFLWVIQSQNVYRIVYRWKLWFHWISSRHFFRKRHQPLWSWVASHWTFHWFWAHHDLLNIHTFLRARNTIERMWIFCSAFLYIYILL